MPELCQNSGSRGTVCANCSRTDLWGGWLSNRRFYPEADATRVAPLNSGVRCFSKIPKNIVVVKKNLNNGILKKRKYEMSLWFYKTDDYGKQSIYCVNIPFQLIFISIVFFVGITTTILSTHFIGKLENLLDSFLLIIVGFAFFLISKISLFVRGIWISWGMKSMAKTFKVMYIVGYILMGLGGIIIISILSSISG